MATRPLHARSTAQRTRLVHTISATYPSMLLCYTCVCVCFPVSTHMQQKAHRAGTCMWLITDLLRFGLSIMRNMPTSSGAPSAGLLQMRCSFQYILFAATEPVALFNSQCDPAWFPVPAIAPNRQNSSPKARRKHKNHHFGAGHPLQHWRRRFS